MNRPAPRKSSLTGSSPVAPPAAAEPAAAAPSEEAEPATRAAVRDAGSRSALPAAVRARQPRGRAGGA